jgi:hypothetical protein
MNRDYKNMRDRMSLRALEVLSDVGSERAVQIYLGAIDALTVAVFAVNGPVGRNSIAVAVDNTKPVELPCDVSA